MAGLKLAAERIGVTRLDFGPQGGRLEFAEDSTADPAALIRLMQESRGNYMMQGPQKLRILVQQDDPAQRLAEMQRVLALLEPDKGNEIQ